MGRETLKDTAGNAVSIDAGESHVITAVLYDSAGTQLAKSSIATLTATLINDADSATINSRSAQSILDTNQGYVATDGTVTFKLTPTDNAIVDSTLSVGAEETHVLLFTWTYTDSDGDTITGEQEWELFVRKLPTPA